VDLSFVLRYELSHLVQPFLLNVAEESNILKNPEIGRSSLFAQSYTMPGQGILLNVCACIAALTYHIEDASRLRNNQSELVRLIDLIGYNQVNQSKQTLYKLRYIINQSNL
jgi:hypothetical protein